MYINLCAGRVHSSLCTGIRSTHILSRFSCCTRDVALTSTKRAHVGAHDDYDECSRVEKKNHDDGVSRNSDRLPINVCVSWDRLMRKSAILSIFLDTNYVGFRTLFRDDGGAVIEERSSREMSVINF